MHDGTQVQETDNTDPGPSSGQHKSQEKYGDTQFVLHQKLVVIKLSKMQCTKFSQF